MKKSFVFLVAVITFVCHLPAQSPQAIKYQAVVRDLNEVLVSGQNVGFRISILQGNIMGPVVYSETQTTGTNQFGLANLEIGRGTVLSGSFSSINWNSGSYFLKLELDLTGGTSYSPLGTSQLLSVPFSFFADRAGNVQTYTGGTGIDITGGLITNTAPDQAVTLTGGAGIGISGNYPGFTITNTSPDQAVTLTGGTGIGISGTYPGFSISNTSPDQTVMLNSGTGINISGAYPGFTITNSSPNAVHSGDVTGSQSLTVERIQGRSVSPAAPVNDQVLKWDGLTGRWTPKNDDNSGGTLTGAGTSTQLAFWTGASSLGTNPDLYWDSTNSRLGIGTSGPAVRLDVAGMIYSRTGGFRFPDNTIQTTAVNGYSLNASDGNPADALYMDANGNVGINTLTPDRMLEIYGRSLSSEELDAVLHLKAMWNPQIYMDLGGSNADAKIRFRDYFGNDRWAILLDGSEDALKFTRAGTDALCINTMKNVGIGTTQPTYKLYVVGTGYATGGWSGTSDAEYKKNVSGIIDALGLVSQLNGKVFDWKRDEYPDKAFPPGRHFGLIAQEVEKVLPGVVTTSSEGDKGIFYDEIIPVLVEAVKQLKQQNAIQAKRIDALEARLTK